MFRTDRGFVIAGRMTMFVACPENPWNYCPRVARAALRGKAPAAR
jgi:hypothetical protein